MTKFSTITLHLTKPYVTFAIASSNTYSEIRQNLFITVYTPPPLVFLARPELARIGGRSYSCLLVYCIDAGFCRNLITDKTRAGDWGVTTPGPAPPIATTIEEG